MSKNSNDNISNDDVNDNKSGSKFPFLAAIVAVVLGGILVASYLEQETVDETSTVADVVDPAVPVAVEPVVAADSTVPVANSAVADSVVAVPEGSGVADGSSDDEVSSDVVESDVVE